jgi:hypothetical protein
MCSGLFQMTKSLASEETQQCDVAAYPKHGFRETCPMFQCTVNTVASID